MMIETFLWLLNNSICVVWLVPAILIVRLLLSRTSRVFSCLLWALLAIRLLLPVGIESHFSVLPDTAPIEQESFDQLPALTQIAAPTKAEAPAVYDLTALQNLRLEPQAENRTDLLEILSVLWLIGFLGMLGYTVGGSLALKRRLAPSLSIHLCL